MSSPEELIREWPRAFGFENVEIGGADGTRLRFVVGGPKAGPPVVLLHGAPQLSYAWRRVMTLLQDRYRVIAPDLRGYGGSKLAVTGRYDMEVLVEDLGITIAWARARYQEALAAPADTRVLLVGHDWGGPIGWTLAEERPELVRHLIAVNGPHPAAFVKELYRPRQLLRSWYMALFQVPLLELVIDQTDAAPFLWMMTASSAPGTFGEVDLALYQAALRRPGRVAAALAYYRQGRRHLRRRRAPPVGVPVTVVWGEADRALHPAIADRMRRYAARIEVRKLPGVSHWVPEERPEAVAEAVVDADRAGQVARRE